MAGYQVANEKHITRSAEVTRPVDWMHNDQQRP